MRKEKRKFPYFTVGSNNFIYHSFKRVYALEQLHKSGLIPKLLSLKTAKTIILFGSIARGDWYKGSDIDIFVECDKKDEKKINNLLELYKKTEEYEKFKLLLNYK